MRWTDSHSIKVQSILIRTFLLPKTKQKTKTNINVVYNLK